MKKILSLFFALCIAVCTWAEVVASGTCGAEGNEENVTWSLDDEGTLTISGTGKMFVYEPTGEWDVCPLWSGYKDDIHRIVVEDGVTNAASFYRLREITEVVLANTVEDIENNAFSVTAGHSIIILPSSLKTIKRAAFSESQIVPASFPEGLERIEVDAFTGSWISGDITFPSTLNYLSGDSFYGCQITSATIPATLTEIAGDPFDKTLIETIVVDPANPVYDSRENCNAIIHTETNTMISASINTVIPSSVRVLGGFRGRFMETVIIPEGVVWISGDAFWECPNLKTVVIPNSCLGTLYSDNGKMGALFNGTWSVENLTIGASITDIREWTYFGGEEVNNIKELYVYAKVPPLCDESLFSVCGANPYARLHVPAGCITAYRDAPGWSNFMNIVGDAILIENNEENYTVTDDGRDYTNNRNMHIDHLHYTRTFNNTNWQPLYVPFSMNYDDWKDNFDVARITNFHSYDYNYDGTIDATYMEFLFVTSGNTEPSYPYLIKAKTTGIKTIDVEDVILQAAEDLSIDCSSVDLKYVFKGNYQVYNILAESTNEYAMQGGLLCQPNGAAILNPFRWHLTIQTRFGNSTVPQRIALRQEGTEESEELTSLENVTATSFSGNLYTIDGRFVTTLNAENDIYSLGLPSGIYLINKQKVVIP